MISCHIHNYASVFGGQERYVELLAGELQRRSIDCEFSGGPERLECAFLRTRSGTVPSLRVEILNGNHALYVRSWRKSDADIRIYVQHSDVRLGGGFSVRRLIRMFLLKILLTRMDAVIRVCARELPEWYAPGKTTTIYNGVVPPTTPQRTFGPHPFTLLMVGSIDKRKNQILALRLLEWHKDLRLILVGNGSRMEEWKAWAEEHGIAARVTWTGFVDEPQKFYAQADVLLMLSRSEAFPLVVLEAMSCGLPVVSVPVGGIPEAFCSEESGLVLLHTYDLSELSRVVQQLADRPALLQHLGAAARATIYERFTLGVMVDQFVRVIKNTAQRRGLLV